MRHVQLTLSFVISGLVFGGCGSDSEESYITRPVTRADITSTISATGTLQPEELVDVGAQVAGMIEAFGRDADGKQVDFGSTVEEGTVLAEIDDSLYTAEVAGGEARLAEANAGELRANADLLQLKARLLQAERDWERAEQLVKTNAIAKSAYDSARYALDSSRANVGVGQAAIIQSQALQAQARASLERAQKNLSYCTIRSPVRGVIIDRRVNIGQTVVSSLNAPSLFLIAKDLRRMQLWVSVNEADIGRIRARQQVTFTVDSFPGEEFAGEVGKVRLNAAMTQNVVNYTVEVTTDNSNLRLLPYLTANVHFMVASKNSVVTVPNAALRWSPPAAAADEQAVLELEEADDVKFSPAVFVVRDGKAVRVSLETGISDGKRTEVVSGDISEEDQVIIGLAENAPGSQAAGASPFVPQMRRGRR